MAQSLYKILVISGNIEPASRFRRRPKFSGETSIPIHEYVVRMERETMSVAGFDSRN